MNDEIATELHWVTVEGPEPGDANFLGRWLLAAADVDTALEQQLKQNPGLKEPISTFEAVYGLFSFSPAAMRFLVLMKDLNCFTLDLWDEWGDIFAVMAVLGLFRQTGERYQMALPQEINGPMIEDALLKLAATEDEDGILHPEDLASCLTKTDAHNYQDFLVRVQQFDTRCEIAISGRR